jgi:hypothetical protein
MHAMPDRRGSREVYRAMAAIGGALGALPLLAPARTLATRLFPVPELPGIERVTLDVKQATYFETAVLVLCVPAAAIFFGRILPAFLESRGVSALRAHLPGVGFATSLLLWRAGSPARVALAAGLGLAALVVCASFFRRPRILVPLVLLAVFVAGLVAYYRPAGRVDLFEDGLILFGANSLSAGGRPYLDVYPVHGWGADGGLNAVFFRYAEHDLQAFRLLRAVMTALALACLAAASILFFKNLWWAALGFVSCLAFCPYLSERHMPALLAYCFLIRASRSDSSGNWVWAGVISAVTLFVTLDFGIMLIVAGAVGPAAISLLARESPLRAVPATLRFGVGALIGCLPFIVALSSQGAFGEFVRVSFVEIPSVITPTWGFPAGSFAQAAREGSLLACLDPFGSWLAPSLCVLFLVLVAGIVVLLFRAGDRVLDVTDRGAAICLLVAILALRGVLGRADPGHRMIYGVFAGLPAAWLLHRAWTAKSRFRPLVFGLTAAAFFFFLRPDRALSRELTSVAESENVRTQEARESVRVPGYGSAMLARDQASDVQNLRRVIDEVVPRGKTFFEFGNEPGLYFLLGRRPPVRYSHVPSYQTIEKQHEVIAALERERPPVAILSSGTERDSFDGVPNRDRAPLVQRFLDSHYRVVGKVGRRTLGVWKNP